MKIIVLNNGMEAMVDDEDYELVMRHTWAYSQPKGCNSGYAQTTVKAQPLSMHRMVLGLQRGDGQVCDHIDCNGLNNQKSNLRIATKAQNAMNRGPNKNNKVGLKGVQIRKASKTRPYIAVIRANYKSYYLGSFNTAEEAAQAYQEAAKRLHGEFAYRAAA